MKIRFAEERDSETLRKIYGQYIDTPVTFECELPGEREFAERIRNIAAFYPYLVCEEAGRILGYAYAHRQKERAAYQWNAELSVYLDQAAVSRGIGKKQYRALGTYHSTGNKCGKWHDVREFGKQIAPCEAEPVPVRPIHCVPASETEKILSGI